MAIPSPRPDGAAFVTGASSGIGREIARRLAADGHNFVLAARRRDRLDAIAAEFPDRRVVVFEVELSDVAARSGLVAALDDVDLQIDIAVLSAGFGMTGPFLTHPAERIPEMIRTNLESTMVTRRYRADARMRSAHPWAMKGNARWPSQTYSTP